MKADTVTKDYISDSRIFADVFNYYIYGGRQVIQPEQLKECDTAEIALPYGTDGKIVPVQKFRDVQKLYTNKNGMELQLVIYGVENQTEIHYAMPVKNNLYEALEYVGQVEKMAKEHRRVLEESKGSETKDEEVQKKPNRGEFLSGFWKEDKLIPSITVTIYFGADKWDAPLSLVDMMRETDSDILKYVDNYHVNLIAPEQMDDSEILKFQSDLKYVLLFIKYSENKEKLKELLNVHENGLSRLERRAADVIKVITNVDIEYNKKEERVNMCQAWKEMKYEVYMEGVGDGERKAEQRIREAEQVGREEGRREGLEKGKLIERICTVHKKMLRGKTSWEMADEMEGDISDIEKIKAAISEYKKMHENEEFDANKVLEYLD